MNAPPTIVIDDEALRAFLSESLGPLEMARVEKAVRESASLRDRLEEVRLGRGGEDQFHTLGAIWRRHRLTCPNRQQLGSFLMDAIDPGMAQYVQFHLEVVGCPYCQANVEDLRALTIAAASAGPTIEFRSRVFQSSIGLLGNAPEA